MFQSIDYLTQQNFMYYGSQLWLFNADHVISF